METWRTAAYLRLSREDGDKVESDSIANQHKYYADDGYTGTNFDRPAFRRMEEDIHQGKVNCVLVKDDCVNIELKSEGLENAGLCDVSSVF